MRFENRKVVTRIGRLVALFLFGAVSFVNADVPASLTKLIDDIVSAPPSAIRPLAYRLYLFVEADKAKYAANKGNLCRAEAILSRVRLDLDGYGGYYGPWKPNWNRDPDADDHHGGRDADGFLGLGVPNVAPKTAATLTADLVGAEAQILSSPGTSACGGSASAASSTSTVVTVTSSDNQQVTLHLAFPAAKFVTETGGGQQYLRMFLDGMGHAGSGSVGQPELPATAQLVAVPLGANVSVNVLGVSSFQLPGVRLWPVQPEAAAANSRQIDLTLLPPGPLPFTINPVAYNSQSPLPIQPASAGPVQQLRGLQLSAVQTSGGQYIPATGQLTVFTGMDVQIQFGGGNTGSFGSLDVISPWNLPFQNLYQKSLKNWDTVHKYLGGQLTIHSFCGEEMMVVTGSTYAQAAEQFANDRTTHGVLSKVFLEDGPNGIGITPTAIRTAIANEYNAPGCIHPSYVTLLGDTSEVPTFETSLGFTSGNPNFYEDPIATDLPYGLLHQAQQFDQGDFSDLYPDIFVGRIPAQFDSFGYRALGVVKMILAYEDNPPPNKVFYQNVSGSEFFQACPDIPCYVQVPAGTPGPQFVVEEPSDREWMPFMIGSENAGRLASVAGKTFNRVAQDGQDYLDPVYSMLLNPLYLLDGSPLPAGINFNGSDLNLQGDINAGSFLVWHSDHGNVDGSGWFEPPFDSGDLASLINGIYTPVMWSSDCDSAKYDSATLISAYVTGGQVPSYGENALESLNVVAFVGASRESPVEADRYLLEGMAKSLFPEEGNVFCAVLGCGVRQPVEELGPLLEAARVEMIASEGASTGANYGLAGTVLEYNVLGDPSMTIRRDVPLDLRGLQVQATTVNTSVLISTSQQGYDGTVATLTDANGDYLGRGILQSGIAAIDVPAGVSGQQGIQIILSGDGTIPTSYPLTIPQGQ